MFVKAGREVGDVTYRIEARRMLSQLPLRVNRFTPSSTGQVGALELGKNYL
jgi:hypothetical protein